MPGVLVTPSVVIFIAESRINTTLASFLVLQCCTLSGNVVFQALLGNADCSPFWDAPLQKFPFLIACVFSLCCALAKNTVRFHLLHSIFEIFLGTGTANLIKEWLYFCTFVADQHYFYADPYPAFYLNAIRILLIHSDGDPDPASQNDADPNPQHCSLKLHNLENNFTELQKVCKVCKIANSVFFACVLQPVRYRYVLHPQKRLMCFNFGVCYLVFACCVPQRSEVKYSYWLQLLHPSSWLRRPQLLRQPSQLLRQASPHCRLGLAAVCVGLTAVVLVSPPHPQTRPPSCCVILSLSAIECRQFSNQASLQRSRTAVFSAVAYKLSFICVAKRNAH